MDSGFMYTMVYSGQNNPNECVCVKPGEAYCVPFGQNDWKNALTLYKDNIAPNLEKCHSSYRYDPVAWIFCNGTAVATKHIHSFVGMVHTVTMYPYSKDEGVGNCVNTIHPLSSANFKMMAEAHFFALTIVSIVWLIL
jgi:hypothetical protein